MAVALGRRKRPFRPKGRQTAYQRQRRVLEEAKPPRPEPAPYPIMSEAEAKRLAEFRARLRVDPDEVL